MHELYMGGHDFVKILFVLSGSRFMKIYVSIVNNYGEKSAKTNSKCGNSSIFIKLILDFYFHSAMVWLFMTLVIKLKCEF